MAYGYGGDPDGRVRAILVGAVAGALVVGLAWFSQWWLTSDEVEPAPEVSTRQPLDEEPTADGEATSHLDRCQAVYDAQSGPLRAAADSLAQWEVHIGAMNKLVVGAITLKQAWEFWNQTRVGASRRLQEFSTAHRRFGQRIYRCPAPIDSAEATPELRTCSRAVVARNKTIRRARVALGTWQQHVRHMEMLRSGEMTAQEATELWLQNWRQGDREVQAYRAAARAAEGKTC